LAREALVDGSGGGVRRAVGDQRARHRHGRSPRADIMRRSRFAVLWRAFFAQFFASESVTSDQQLRYAMVGILALILTPCLLILINVFPQFQLLVIRVGKIHPPPGVVVRATAMRNINAEDMIEWFISILVAYSMVTVGLIAAAAWDALSFDRRDAMV